MSTGVRVNAIFPGTVATPLIDRTALATEFGGQMTAEHLAEALIRLLEFPVDCLPETLISCRRWAAA